MDLIAGNSSAVPTDVKKLSKQLPEKRLYMY